MSQLIEPARIVTTNTGRTFERTMSLLMGAQGYKLKEQRKYKLDVPAPVRSQAELVEMERIVAERKAKLAAAKAKRQESESFNAMVSMTQDVRDRFNEWFMLADFTPITGNGNSVMGTLMFPDWLDREVWERKVWQTYKKFIDQLNKHGVRAWGDGWASSVHTEFEVDSEGRPHFHIWFDYKKGVSSYAPGSEFAKDKHNLQGRVFHRWLEAVWGYITNQRADLIEPRLTWVPRTKEERAKYAQDLDTPVKIARYWLKEGKNSVMAEKRLQLRPPAAWIARKQRFRWFISFGIELEFVQVDSIAMAQEQQVREVGVSSRESVWEVDEVTGAVRDTERFSLDAKQGAKQIEIVSPEKRAALLAPFGLN
jgi:hypothetical protein